MYLCAQVRRPAEHYLCTATGKKRSELLAALGILLERDDVETRRAVCQALALMKVGATYGYVHIALGGRILAIAVVCGAQ
jgi:hypothetical protein